MADSTDPHTPSGGPKPFTHELLNVVVDESIPPDVIVFRFPDYEYRVHLSEWNVDA
jgi:hypothetical protein